MNPFSTNVPPGCPPPTVAQKIDGYLQRHEQLLVLLLGEMMSAHRNGKSLVIPKSDASHLEGLVLIALGICEGQVRGDGTIEIRIRDDCHGQVGALLHFREEALRHRWRNK